MTIESVKMKISKIGLRHVLSWPKLGLESKFHDPWTFGGFGKRGQTHRQTRFMFHKYRCNVLQITAILLRVGGCVLQLLDLLLNLLFLFCF